jgi:hypothetical protein
MAPANTRLLTSARSPTAFADPLRQHIAHRRGCEQRAAERWRGLRFTEFELRQIAAVRKELDVEYAGDGFVGSRSMFD